MAHLAGGIDADEGMTLNVQDIDANWLQGKITQAYDQQIDPQQSQELAEEVRNILDDDGAHDRVVESKLLLHLGFDKFRLTQYLVRNRLKIVWGTRLARAVDEETRRQIEEDMMALHL